MLLKIVSPMLLIAIALLKSVNLHSNYLSRLFSWNTNDCWSTSHTDVSMFKSHRLYLSIQEHKRLFKLCTWCWVAIWKQETVCSPHPSSLHCMYHYLMMFSLIRRMLLLVYLLVIRGLIFLMIWLTACLYSMLIQLLFFMD